MKILAIETSCDETGVAILEGSGTRENPVFDVLANVVSSQVDVHKDWGGVVPNLAKREHQKNLPFVLLEALQKADFSISKSELLISKEVPNTKNQTLASILEREP